MLTGLVLGGLLSLATAQFPPKPEGITVLQSKLHENVTLSFKEVCTHGSYFDHLLIVSLAFVKPPRASDLIQAMCIFLQGSSPRQERCRITPSTRTYPDGSRRATTEYRIAFSGFLNPAKTPPMPPWPSG